MGKIAAVSGFSEEINAVWFSLIFLRGGGGWVEKKKMYVRFLVNRHMAMGMLLVEGGGGGEGGTQKTTCTCLVSVTQGQTPNVMYLLSFHHTQRTHHISELRTCLLSSRVTSSC